MASASPGRLARLEGPRLRAVLAAPGSDWMRADADGFWRPDVRAPFRTGAERTAGSTQPLHRAGPSLGMGHTLNTMCTASLEPKFREHAVRHAG
jgi:hypothetical protein